MTIKDVEKKLNISRANIRFYEKEGLLDPKRFDNEYRDYSDDDIKRLEKILLFRKCNVSINDIRLIFNGIKSIDEVFKEQISIIENEINHLEGAKEMCKKLAQEKSDVENIDINKYLDIMNDEEDKGNKFYDIVEDYILANEKLYQSIIENKNFKGGDIMKKNVKVLVYLCSFILTALLLGLFEFIFNDSIDWSDVICFAGILSVIDLLGSKKYIEKKEGKKFTKKDNVNHFIITIIIMIITLVGYLSIKSIYEVYENPKSTILELSVKKALIDIAQEKYENDNYSLYGESHKILGYEVKDNKIYVYLVARYGLYNKDNCESNNESSDELTLIFNEEKNDEGIYELKEYKENTISNKYKNKANVNYQDNYFVVQLNKYCNV